MPDTKAKVGDIIRIIGGICNGNTYVVVECHKDSIDMPSRFWTRMLDKNGVISGRSPGFFRSGTKYEIIGYCSESPTTSREDDVDDNLNSRRDDNLRSVFS